eukprot:GABU01003320.1.p1 GENE.GABU01003320.1~~GABU01003320.1.p1  ORF type:complete len:124 (+),score=39.16 GABU01003320.1:2-373(+)
MGKYKEKLLRPSGVSKRKVESDFGRKMMEKMGWKGDEEGLGAEGAGIKECIQISRREELEGLGYAEKRVVDDNWWKNSFNQALSKVSDALQKHNKFAQEQYDEEEELNPRNPHMPRLSKQRNH